MQNAGRDIMSQYQQTAGRTQQAQPFRYVEEPGQPKYGSNLLNQALSSPSTGKLLRQFGQNVGDFSANYLPGSVI